MNFFRNPNEQLFYQQDQFDPKDENIGLQFIDEFNQVHEFGKGTFFIEETQRQSLTSTQ